MNSTFNFTFDSSFKSTFSSIFHSTFHPTMKSTMRPTMLKTLVLRLTLLLVLAGGMGNVPAAGLYHVTLDTTALSGRSGWLDFVFTGLSNAAPATVDISGFTGDTSGTAFAAGDAAGTLAAGVRIGNGAGWNEYGQWLALGGVLAFDVAFDTGAADAGTGAGTTLAITLLDHQFGYLPGTGDLVTFALQPGAPAVVTADSAFATVTAVPEPATAAQLLGGLLVMAAVLRSGRRR